MKFNTIDEKNFEIRLDNDTLVCIVDSDKKTITNCLNHKALGYILDEIKNNIIQDNINYNLFDFEDEEFEPTGEGGTLFSFNDNEFAEIIGENTFVLDEDELIKAIIELKSNN